MLLADAGLPDEAKRVERAVFSALADGVATQDLGGNASTVLMTDAVIKRLDR